jgi:hypothetical protein
MVVFSGVRVVQSLVFFVVFCRSIVCPFSLDHCRQTERIIDHCDTDINGQPNHDGDGKTFDMITSTLFSTSL